MLQEEKVVRPIVELSSIAKRFGGVTALQNVSLQLKRGTVLALVGENGAGKSTLINIMSGLFSPDEGAVALSGHPVIFHGPHHALDSGIAVVHQELTLFMHLPVWKNVFAGHELYSRQHRRLKRAEMIVACQKFFASLEIDIDPTARVESLSLADQQMVEICKALTRNPQVLILDEATSALDAHQVANLFRYIKQLKADGVSIVFVSHRMYELMEIADEAVVLKDGQLVANLESLEGVTETDLIEKMAGRSFNAMFPDKAEVRQRDAMLTVKDLKSGKLNRISLEVGAGEIVGVGGLQGHGQAELLRLLFGAEPIHGGHVFLDSKEVKFRSPIKAIDSGIAYVPPDRKTEGLLLAHSVEENLTLTLLRMHLATAFGRLRFKRQSKVVGDIRQALRIRQRTWKQPVESLSGGNQQKVVLGKWLETGFKLLLLDEPTRGIDVGTKVEIYKFLRQLTETGVSILVASTDNLELIGLCDRVYILYEGNVSAMLSGDTLTDYNFTQATMGVYEEGGVSE